MTKIFLSFFLLGTFAQGAPMKTSRIDVKVAFGDAVSRFELKQGKQGLTLSFTDAKNKVVSKPVKETDLNYLFASLDKVPKAKVEGSRCKRDRIQVDSVRNGEVKHLRACLFGADPAKSALVRLVNLLAGWART